MAPIEHKVHGKWCRRNDLDADDMFLWPSCQCVVLHGRHADAHITLMSVAHIVCVTTAVFYFFYSPPSYLLASSVTSSFISATTKLFMSTIWWWTWHGTNRVCIWRSGRGVAAPRQWRHIVYVMRCSASYGCLPVPEGARCKPPACSQFNTWSVPMNLCAS